MYKIGRKKKKIRQSSWRQKFDNDTRGAETMGPWKFKLIPEAEQWGKVALPTKGKVVKVTSTKGRRSLRLRRRRCATTLGHPTSDGLTK